MFGSVENHGEERFAARIFATAGLGVALLHSDVALKLRITADLECVATIRRMFGYSLERRMSRFVELAHCGDEQIEIQPDQHFLIFGFFRYFGRLQQACHAKKSHENRNQNAEFGQSFDFRKRHALACEEDDEFLQIRECEFNVRSFVNLADIGGPFAVFDNEVRAHNAAFDLIAFCAYLKYERFTLEFLAVFRFVFRNDLQKWQRSVEEHSCRIEIILRKFYFFSHNFYTSSVQSSLLPKLNLERSIPAAAACC